MTNSNRYPSYADCIEAVLSQSVEPITLDRLILQIGKMRPLTKGSRAAVLKAMDDLYQAVPVGTASFGWLPHLLTGTTIRHTLETDEVRRGYIMLDELEHMLFFPDFFQEHTQGQRALEIELWGGETVPATASAERDVWALHVGAPMAEWLDDAGSATKDDLIIHVVDAAAGRYLLRLQPQEIRDERAIEERNRALAQGAELIAEELLGRRGVLFTWELVARLISNGLYHDPLPPDDLHAVLSEYSRLHLVAGEGYELELGEHKPPTLQAGKRPAPQSPTSGRRLLFDSGSDQGDFMDDPKGVEPESDDDTCGAYDEYLEAFRSARRAGAPLSHDDYHLLEAELENLVDLELEFGYLLADQTARKQDLAERLFIDPESLVDGSWDDGDDLDSDSPAFWN